ncbi:TetR/AcrR family transcriptional regulator [Mycobacterium sp. IDR2000157661]|uniref:TetR/AcrR family transcriptional regulator n=1 Tax=Mycobacterium sp. IDR2000157661 TaxID=2867005 RepID=UPI001EEA4F09|nr:TetR/AcrR family transcriptional regulator [Mycobacterium sp. IDR2000157661]ULE31408.1 TetR/AcrR family transcriptional regulator [Mycobacterium sp. IDR2000157661]
MQPESADDERGSIIDAAYACLSEPHSGAVPVAAILQRAGVSTRAFYRHFESKDELFLAMLRQETDALAARLDRVLENHHGDAVDQLEEWIEGMFGLIHDDQTRLHFTVIDSDEVRAARGYRELRERGHADRERSLVAILRRGRDDGSFPLARPEEDAMAINAMISRLMIAQSYDDHDGLKRAKADILDFALRAMGADRPAAR